MNTATPSDDDSMDRRLSPIPWYKRKIPLAAAIAAACIAVAILVFGDVEKTTRVALEQLIVSTTEEGVFDDTVGIRGRVEPKDIVFIDAQEGGRVENVLKRSGDYVEKGDPLIEFGNTDLQLQVIEREARLIEQVNNLRTIESNLEQTRITNERTLADLEYNVVRLTRSAARYRSLAKQGSASKEQQDIIEDELSYLQNLRPKIVDSSKLQNELRLRRLPEIKDGLLKLQQNLLIVRGKLDNLVVRAPIAGRITGFDLKIGEIRDRGARLAEITPDSGYKIVIDIDEFYLSRVRQGQSATVEMDNRSVETTVVRVYPEVNAGRFTVDLEFTSPNEENNTSLTSGQSIQGRLILGESKKTLLIPNGPFAETTGGNWVFVLSDDRTKAERRTIRVGARTAQQLEILAGLRPGEEVITSGYEAYRDATALQIVN